MSAVRALSRNILFVWLGFASQVLITFLMTPFMIRSLGSEGYGIWILMQSLTGYYGLIDMGLRAGVTQSVTRRLASGDTDSVVRYFNGIYPLLIRVALSLIAVGLVVGLFLNRTLSLSASVNGSVVPIALFQSAGLAATMLLFPFTAVLPGLQRYDISESISVITRILSACLCWMAISLSLGLIGVSAAFFIGNLLDQAARTLAALFFVPELADVRPKSDKNELKDLYRVGGWNFVIQMSHQLLHRLNAILVGYLFSVSHLVPFNLAGSLSDHGNRIVSLTTRVLYPAFTQLDASNRTEDNRNLFICMSKLSFAFSLLVAIIGWLWMDVFLDLWLGSVPDKDAVIGSAKSLYLIFALINVTGALRGVGGQMLMGKERLEFMGKVMVFEAALAIALSLVLSYFVGVQGIPLGNLVAFCVSSVFLGFPQCAKIINMSYFGMVNSIFARGLLYNGFSGFLSFLYFMQIDTPTNWREFILYAMLPTSCICLVAVPILLTPFERKVIREMVFTVLRPRLGST